MGHVRSSIRFLLLIADVLCPSVRVGGDRFKHTGGGTKEITGERAGRPARLLCCATCWAWARPSRARWVGGLADPVPPQPWLPKVLQMRVNEAVLQFSWEASHSTLKEQV